MLMTVAEYTASRTSYRICAMKRGDLQTCLPWADQEGWNPGLHDAEAFYCADPPGLFVGEVENQPAGFITRSAGQGEGHVFSTRDHVQTECLGIGELRC